MNRNAIASKQMSLFKNGTEKIVFNEWIDNFYSPDILLTRNITNYSRIYFVC